MRHCGHWALHYTASLSSNGLIFWRLIGLCLFGGTFWLLSSQLEFYWWSLWFLFSLTCCWQPFVIILCGHWAQHYTASLSSNGLISWPLTGLCLFGKTFWLLSSQLEFYWWSLWFPFSLTCCWQPFVMILVCSFPVELFNNLLYFASSVGLEVIHKLIFPWTIFYQFWDSSLNDVSNWRIICYNNFYVPVYWTSSLYKVMRYILLHLN